MVKAQLYNIDNVIGYHINRCYKRTRLQRDELYQIAYLGYMKAQNNFDPKFKRLTLTYVSKYITEALNTAIKKDNRYIGEQDLNEEAVIPTTQMQTAAIIKRVKQCLPKLPVLEQEIVYSTYLAAKPVRIVDLAAKHNLSKSGVHLIKSRALKKIKEYLDDNEEE